MDNNLQIIWKYIISKCKVLAICEGIIISEFFLYQSYYNYINEPTLNNALSYYFEQLGMWEDAKKKQDEAQMEEDINILKNFWL